MSISKKEVLEHQRREMERDEIYRSHGFIHATGISFILQKALPLEGRVLEIGTGKGRFLAELLKYLPSVTTLDISEEEQRLARLNLAWLRPMGKARFLLGDVTRLPWKRATFDAVVSVNALHHFRAMKRALAEMVRVTRRGGKMVLADFDESGFDVLERIHHSEGRVHERHTYSMDDVAAQLSAWGWNILRENGAGQEVLIATRCQ